jgi:prepilin-type processing-associated H-X9-DG protein
MYRHLHNVGNEAFVFPFDDWLELEVLFLGRERSGIAFLDGHAEIDDTHG